jgi:hypothetical protein
VRVIEMGVFAGRDGSLIVMHMPPYRTSRVQAEMDFHHTHASRTTPLELRKETPTSLISLIAWVLVPFTATIKSPGLISWDASARPPASNDRITKPADRRPGCEYEKSQSNGHWFKMRVGAMANLDGKQR